MMGMETTKYIRLTMANGEEWDVPADTIIKHRAATIATAEAKNSDKTFQKIYEEEYKNTFNDNDLIIEWAKTNFHWKDVEFRAFKVAPPKQANAKEKEEAWAKGNIMVVSKV